MNAPTIVVLLIVLAAFVLAVGNEIRKKKKGEGGCSCGCSGCAMKGVCHAKSSEKTMPAANKKR